MASKRFTASLSIIVFILVSIFLGYLTEGLNVKVAGNVKLPSSIRYIATAIVLVSAACSGSIALVLLITIVVIALMFLFGFDFSLYIKISIGQNTLVGVAILAIIPLLFTLKILTPERLKIKKKSLLIEVVRRLISFSTSGFPPQTKS